MATQEPGRAQPATSLTSLPRIDDLTEKPLGCRWQHQVLDVDGHQLDAELADGVPASTQHLRPNVAPTPQDLLNGHRAHSLAERDLDEAVGR